MAWFCPRPADGHTGTHSQIPACLSGCSRDPLRVCASAVTSSTLPSTCEGRFREGSRACCADCRKSDRARCAVGQVWEGDGVVKAGRVLLGATKPSESAPGSIRGDYCIDVGRNICHGSDSVESATAEIKLWFSDAELCDWKSHSEPWIYE
jgi:hypothetical protein